MAKSTTPPPVWFVTGCSTGFGREFARAALAHGFRVVATARDPKTLDNLIAGHRDKAIALTLDVTNPDQIKKAVIEAEHAFGRIDVLVNNAGYGYMAAVEEGEEKDIRALFDTNFFGLAAMIRAVLPGMRARREGTIVNIASVGKDTADKHRLETAGHSGTQPGDPARAAEAVIKVVQSPKPPRHLVLGRQGFDNVENQLRSMLQEVDRWKATSLSADYPAA